MTAIEELNAFAKNVREEEQKVREEYDKLGLVSLQRLMSRTKQFRAEDAIYEEARQRVLRNKWAEVTKNS